MWRNRKQSIRHPLGTPLYRKVDLGLFPPYLQKSRWYADEEKGTYWGKKITEKEVHPTLIRNAEEPLKQK